MKKCAITGQEVPDNAAVPLRVLPPLLHGYIRHRYPDLPEDAWISRSALDELRSGYIEAALQSEIGEITELEREVIDSLRDREVLTERPQSEDEEDRAATFGEKLSDRIADFGGSWSFILIFTGFLAVWILLNALQLFGGKAVDPYPFILLNLLLSCVAALQAPIIMMSQNRQSAKDRSDARSDYEVNLRAEVEIAALHTKLDLLREQEWTRLLAVVEQQRQALDDIRRQLAQGGPAAAPD